MNINIPVEEWIAKIRGLIHMPHIGSRIPEVKLSMGGFRFPVFRRVRRGLAWLLLLVNGGLCFASLAGSPSMLLLFLPNSFIIFDYLFKTRRKN